MVSYLTGELWFPSPHRANRDGVVAIGGDLSVERLLLAYRNGIFPWPIFERYPMVWFSPDPRAILELDALHVSRSLRKEIRKGRHQTTFNRCFREVIEKCALRTPQRGSTWITPELREAYVELHRHGHAHSVECWLDDELVGGLYGVQVGAAFAGESMFSRSSNASKIALVALVERLVERRFELLDIQQHTPHLASMGAVEIPRQVYLGRLARAAGKTRNFL